MTAKDFPYENLNYLPTIDQVKPFLESLIGPIMKLPEECEFEKLYLLAAIRRTLSLLISFRHSVEVGNEQMAATILRLNLDTVARTYILFWAEETPGMTAETFAADVFNGKSIHKMKFRGSSDKARDWWLIEQISGLDVWVKDVYRETSGAVHFSDFHLKRVLQQHTRKEKLPDGSLMIELAFGGTEKHTSPDSYRIMQQAFCHITALLLVAIQDRCGLLSRDKIPSSDPDGQV